MYFGNDRGGAGGLFTTAADLAIWNDAIMSDKLGKGVSAKIQEPAVLNNGRKLNYARGLNIELRRGRGGRLVWHTGGAAGYSALAGHLPEHKISVGIMCNQDGTARTAYASRIFDLFLPAEPPPVESPVPSQGVPPPGGLAGKAGTFFNEQTGEALRLGVNGNTLSILAAGPLGPMGPDRFRNLRPTLYFMSEAEFELTYLTPDRIEIKTKDGVVSRYRRALTWTPTADDLKAYAGRFYSEELMATFDVNPTKEGLAVQANAGNTVEFKAVERDVFQVGQILLRFRRDNAGKITGLELTNPLLRNVKFSRSAER